jgi:hypothetical protein
MILVTVTQTDIVITVATNAIIAAMNVPIAMYVTSPATMAIMIIKAINADIFCRFKVIVL